MSLMLHGVPGWLLLWCLPASNKCRRADTVEVPQGGLWLNLAPCRTCSRTKHRSVKIAKENCRSSKKTSQSGKSVGSGSQGRAELVSPSTCCSLVFLWKELIVTLLRDVMLSYLLTSWSFKNISSSFLPVRPRRSWVSRHWALKVTRDGETLL